MREKTYHLYLNEEERSRVIQSLIELKSYCAVLLEGAVIVLACIIFSVFASSPPVVNPDAAAVTQVWAYIGELVFNMLCLAFVVVEG